MRIRVRVRIWLRVWVRVRVWVWVRVWVRVRVWVVDVGLAAVLIDDFLVVDVVPAWLGSG